MGSPNQDTNISKGHTPAYTKKPSPGQQTKKPHNTSAPTCTRSKQKPNTATEYFKEVDSRIWKETFQSPHMSPLIVLSFTLLQA